VLIRRRELHVLSFCQLGLAPHRPRCGADIVGCLFVGAIESKLIGFKGSSLWSWSGHLTVEVSRLPCLNNASFVCFLSIGSIFIAKFRETAVSSKYFTMWGLHPNFHVKRGFRPFFIKA
jgi:hypothetical protein